MPTFRVSMILGDDALKSDTHFDHSPKFPGCVDAEEARKKARAIYGKRIVAIKSVKLVEEK